MQTERTAVSDAGNPQWAIVERWQEYEGEVRANLLRVLSIAGFYVVELINYHGLRFSFLEMPQVAGVDRSFHLAVMALAVAWIISGWGVLAFLRHRIFPPALKFISTGVDIVFLTAILLVADGPKSPLVVAYFLVQCLCVLRFSLPLIRFTTLGSIAGYLFLLGNAKWFRMATRVPRYHQAVFLLALAFSGILFGQIMRRVRKAAEDYAARLARSAGQPA